jgi:hypothetical protein
MAQVVPHGFIAPEHARRLNQPAQGLGTGEAEKSSELVSRNSL